MGFSRRLKHLALAAHPADELQQVDYVMKVVIIVVSRCRLGIFDQECQHRVNHAHSNSSKSLGRAKNYELLSAEGVLSQYLSTIRRASKLARTHQPNKRQVDRRSVLRTLAKCHKSVKKGGP